MLSPLLLLSATLGFGQSGSFSPKPTQTVGQPTPCNLGSLPLDIQTRLNGDFASWKIQEAAMLSEHARKTWEGKEPAACPGIAVGLFQNAKVVSYAVLLVPVGHPDAGYRFVVFSRKTGQASYEATIIEKFDGHGASNYFMRKVLMGRFFNEDSKRKFQVQTPEGILMIDSAEKEYEADIYFWSNGRYRQEPIDE
jgi:hypothetical protein